MKLQLLLYLITSSVLTSCISEECKNTGMTYVFEVPATLSPARDTFLIGDTISIVSSFSNEVLDRETGRVYELNDFLFFPGTEIARIDQLRDDELAYLTGIDDFELIFDPGSNYGVRTYSTGEKRLRGQYAFSENHYHLAFKLVPKTPGLYYIEQGIAPHISADQAFEGRCHRTSIYGSVNMNDGADNNIHLLNDSPEPHFSEWIPLKPQDRFYDFGGYCFYVK